MNWKRSPLKLIVLALAVTVFGIVTCSAQETQATFNLDEQAQMGRVVLQPGRYTLTLTRFQGGQREVIIRSDQSGSPAAILLPQSDGPSPALQRAELVCYREGGILVVHALEVAPLGEALFFHMPQNTQIYALNHGIEGQAPPAQSSEAGVSVPIRLSRR